MSDNRFRNGHYEDALQYTKDVLSHSSSIEEIIVNTSLEEDEKENQDE